MEIRTWDNREGGYFQNHQCHRKIGKGKEVSFPKPFILCHFYFRNIKDRFVSAQSQTQQHIWIPVRHKSVLTPPMLDPGG